MYRALLGVYRALLGVYRALLGVCRALLWAYRALLGVHRALLGVHRALVGMHGALLGVYRSLLGVYGALMRTCSVVLIEERDRERDRDLTYCRSAALRCALLQMCRALLQIYRALFGLCSFLFGIYWAFLHTCSASAHGLRSRSAAAQPCGVLFCRCAGLFFEDIAFFLGYIGLSCRDVMLLPTKCAHAVRQLSPAV